MPRSRTRALLAPLLLCHLALPTLAADTQNGVTFVFPLDSGHTYNYLDVLNVSYISPFKAPILFIFCDGGNENVRTINKASPFNGSNLVELDWSADKPCYFNLRPDEAPGHGANSDNFTLLRQVKSQATIGQFGTSTESVATPTTADSSGPSGAEPTGVSAGDGGDREDAPREFSAGAVAGIAIGSALGTLAIAAAALALVLRRRRCGKKAGSYTPPPPSGTLPYEPVGWGVVPKHELYDTEVKGPPSRRDNVPTAAWSPAWSESTKAEAAPAQGRAWQPNELPVSISAADVRAIQRSELTGTTAQYQQQ